MCLLGRTDVRGFAAEQLAVLDTETLSGIHQVIVRAALFPVQLVDGPGSDAGLFEILDLRLLQLFRERITCPGELIERELIELVHVRVDVRLGH